MRLGREPALDTARARLARGGLRTGIVSGGGGAIAGDDVGAAAEVIAGAFEQDRPHAFVGARGLDRGDERRHRVVVDRVALLRTVQPQRQHAPIVEHRLQAHRRENSSEIALERAREIGGAAGWIRQTHRPRSRLGRRIVA